MTVNVDDYVARIEGTCGEEKDIIVTFRYEKREEAARRILQKAVMKKSFMGVVSELFYKNHSFRLYSSGKAIFRSLKSKEELNSILTELLTQT